MKKQTLTIQVPQPPPGQATSVAKIFVKNSAGKSINYIEYNYRNLCESQQIVDTSPPSTDQDLENAYNSCKDEVADLFCSLQPDIGQFEGSDPQQIQDPKISVFDVSGNKIARGQIQIGLQFSQGSGVFALGVKIVGKPVEVLKIEPIIQPQNNIFTHQYTIPEWVPSGTEIQFWLILYNKKNEKVEERLRTIFTETASLMSVSSNLQRISYDNDLGDAKKEIYITTALVSDPDFKTLSDYQNEYLNINETNYCVDSLREHLGSFWVRKSSDSLELIFAKNRSNKYKRDNSFTFQNSFIGTIDPQSQPKHKYGYFIENLNVKIEKVGAQNPRSKFLSTTNLETKTVLDSTYVNQKPYNYKEYYDTEIPYNSLILDPKIEYNFYNKEYEVIQARDNIPESYLPNMYMVLLNEKAKQIDEKIPNGLEKANSLRERMKAESEVLTRVYGPSYGQLFKDTAKRIVLDPDILKLLALDHQLPSEYPIELGNYYEYFIKNIDNFKPSKKFSSTIKNIVIQDNFLEMMDEFTKKNQQFPMFVDIRFDTSPFPAVSSFLNKTKNSQLIFNSCIASFMTDDERIGTLQQFKQELDNGPTNIFKSDNRYLDLSEIISNITQDIANKNIVNNEDFISLGNLPTNRIKTSDIDTLELDIASLIREKLRTYEEILNGKKCYKETLFYKISKYDSSDTRKLNPLLNVYIPNHPTKNSLRYIDTQVKYDKKYTYTIWSYDVIIANEYTQSFPVNEVPNSIILSTDATIYNRSRLLLVENVFDEFSATVKDHPPVMPQVSFTPYKDNDKQILITLNTSAASFKQKEILIKEEDSEIFRKIRESQMLKEDEMISFSGDDVIKKYQIFRTNRPPKDYQSFSSAKIVEIDTLINPKKPGTNSTFSSFIDNIRPNVKYYYTFRGIDIHNQLSNPSPVFEIEMISENGTKFPIIKEYKFPENQNRIATKTAKRFIMITPDILQKFIDLNSVDKSDINTFYSNLPTPGEIEEKIWDKNFKMRLVSKTTNKVYDIKFKFDINKKKEE